MKKVLVLLTSILCLLTLAACQRQQVEQKSINQKTEKTCQASPVEKRNKTNGEKREMVLKSGVDTIRYAKTGQCAEIHYLNQDQYDSLLQYKDNYTLIPEVLFDRGECLYWDIPEDYDLSQFNQRLDSVMAQHPLLANAWQRQLDKVILSNFDSEPYYRPNSTRDIISEIYHYKQTGEYLLNMWTEHTAYGFWLNEKSTGDSLLLVTSDCAYNGTYLAGLQEADCDYCTDIHIYRRNKESLDIEECLNYIDHDSVLEPSLNWVDSVSLLCKGCYRTETEYPIYFLIKLL